MTLINDLIRSLSKNPKALENTDRNVLLFLYHFGFFDKKWHTLDDTGREYLISDDGSVHPKRARTEQIIKNYRAKLLKEKKLLPSLSKLIDIICSYNFINILQFLQILIENELIDNPSVFNGLGLLRLVNYLGYCKNYNFYTYKMERVTQGRYRSDDMLFLIKDDITEYLQNVFETAKDFSSEYGLVRYSLLLDELEDKEGISEYLLELIEAQENVVVFRTDNNEIYFHIERYKNDGFVSCLGRIFNVSEKVHLRELIEAFRRPISRRLGKDTRDLLPYDAVKKFIESYTLLTIQGDFVTYKGKKARLVGVEAEAAQFLRDKPEGVKYQELCQYLNSRGCGDELVAYLISFSPIVFVDKSMGYKNHQYFLIGHCPDVDLETSENTKYLAIDEIEEIEAEFEHSGNISQEVLKRMLDFARQIGEDGECYVNSYLTSLVADRKIVKLDWASRRDAVSPYDFVIHDFDGNPLFVDVKTTNGDFNRPIHISFRELRKMAESDWYFIYRVYQVNGSGGLMKVSENLHEFGVKILDRLKVLPYSVIIDGITLMPNQIIFSNEIRLAAPR